MEVMEVEVVTAETTIVETTLATVAEVAEEVEEVEVAVAGEVKMRRILLAEMEDMGDLVVRVAMVGITTVETTAVMEDRVDLVALVLQEEPPSQSQSWSWSWSCKPESKSKSGSDNS